MTLNFLLKTFSSACPKSSQPNTKDARKSTLMIFQMVDVVVVVCEGGGERMRERVRDGSTRSCRKGTVVG